MHFDTQHVEIGQKMAKNCQNCQNCVKLRETENKASITNLVPTIPQTPQTDLTRLRNQHDGRMQRNTETRKHASVLYIRITNIQKF